MVASVVIGAPSSVTSNISTTDSDSKSLHPIKRSGDGDDQSFASKRRHSTFNRSRGKKQPTGGTAPGRRCSSILTDDLNESENEESDAESSVNDIKKESSSSDRTKKYFLTAKSFFFQAPVLICIIWFLTLFLSCCGLFGLIYLNESADSESRAKIIQGTRLAVTHKNIQAKFKLVESIMDATSSTLQQMIWAKATPQAILNFIFSQIQSTNYTSGRTIMISWANNSLLGIQTISNGSMFAIQSIGSTCGWSSVNVSAPGQFSFASSPSSYVTSSTRSPWLSYTRPNHLATNKGLWSAVQPWWNVPSVAYSYGIYSQTGVFLASYSNIVMPFDLEAKAKLLTQMLLGPGENIAIFSITGELLASTFNLRLSNCNLGQVQCLPSLYDLLAVPEFVTLYNLNGESFAFFGSVPFEYITKINGVDTMVYWTVTTFDGMGAQVAYVSFVPSVNFNTQYTTNYSIIKITALVVMIIAMGVAVPVLLSITRPLNAMADSIREAFGVQPEGCKGLIPKTANILKHQIGTDQNSKGVKLSRFREIAQAQDLFARMSYIVAALTLFIPLELAQKILLQDSTVSKLAMERRQIALLHIDIVISNSQDTEESESLEKTQLIVSKVMEVLFAQIYAHQGYIDEIQFGSLSAYFVETTDESNPCKAAFRCVSEMKFAVAELTKVHNDWPQFTVRSSVNSGGTFLGNYGRRKQIKHGILGELVSVSHKIHTTCRELPFECTCTDRCVTGHKYGNLVLFRPLFKCVVSKSGSSTLTIYEVVLHPDESAKAKIQSSQRMFEAFYRGRRAHDPPNTRGGTRTLSVAPEDLEEKIAAHAKEFPDDWCPRIFEEYIRAGKIGGVVNCLAFDEIFEKSVELDTIDASINFS